MKNSPSIADAAEGILRKTGHPLHYTELTAKILLTCKLQGKTPKQTIRSCLATNPKFKRVAEGVYGLAEWTEYPVARFAKDIAYDVVKAANKPMQLSELGEAILRERDFIGGPNQAARNVLRSDSRFFYNSRKRLVGLAEWKKR